MFSQLAGTYTWDRPSHTAQVYDVANILGIYLGFICRRYSAHVSSRFGTGFSAVFLYSTTAAYDSCVQISNGGSPPAVTTVFRRFLTVLCSMESKEIVGHIVPVLPALGLQPNPSVDHDFCSLRGVTGVTVRDPWRTSIGSLHSDDSLTAACVSGSECACVLPWCIQYRYWNSSASNGVAYMFAGVPTWRMFRMLCMAEQVKRNLYEVMLPGRPFNMFFDIDFRKPVDISVPKWFIVVDGIWETLMPRLADIVIDVLMQKCSCGGAGLRREDFECFFLRSLDPATGKGFMKFSAHLITKCSKGMLKHMDVAAGLFKAVQDAAHAVHLPGLPNLDTTLGQVRTTLTVCFCVLQTRLRFRNDNVMMLGLSIWDHCSQPCSPPGPPQYLYSHGNTAHYHVHHLNTHNIPKVCRSWILKYTGQARGCVRRWRANAAPTHPQHSNRCCMRATKREPSLHR